MSDEGGGEGIMVKLTRMEGKLDLSNLRHDQNDAWRVTVDQRLHRHGNELMIAKAEVAALAPLPARVDRLEDADKLREGQRQGIITTGRALIWLAGLIPGGLIVAVLTKAFGG